MGNLKAPLPKKWNPRALSYRGIAAIPNILIAHHDEYVRKLIETTLEGEGFSLHSAIDGIDALASIRSSPPDLLVIAKNLPELDGPTVIAAMRQLQEQKRTKVVIVGTGELPAETRSYVDAVLQAPLRPIQLLVVATELLSVRPVTELARDSRAHLRVVT